MDGKRLKEKDKRSHGTLLTHVTTHFGCLDTKRAPMVINLDSLPTSDTFKKVVDKFYEDLQSETPYQYEDSIGEGGMGIVEMVKDRKSLRSIAKKTLRKSSYDKESIIRFTEEAQITAQLEHPNIVPVYEMGLDENDQLFYTMKMVKGRNLKEILNGIKKGDKELIEKFPLSNLLEIYLAVCDAMSYACSRKIVHRDLKPDNIMVGDFGEVYLVDWGLAKVIDNNAGSSAEQIPDWIVQEVYSKNADNEKLLTELRKVDSLRTKDQSLNISFNDILIGTPQYMSPERISGEADECSEVYALGAILYNILTLELTVEGKNLEEIVIKIFDEDIKNPLMFKNLPHLPGGKVPPGLAAVTMKALNAEPMDRYHKVRDLRNEISNWEDGYITEAEKAGPWLILWSMIKRHKMESCIVLSFFVLLISIYTIYAYKLKQDFLLAAEAEKVALEQKRIVEVETANLIEKSLAVENKIHELESLAPKLVQRSMALLTNNEAEKALVTISNACELSPKRVYFIQKGNIQQTLELWAESIESYKRALEMKPDTKRVIESLKFSEEFLNKPLDSYVDLLRFKKLLLSQQRFTEAAFISERLKNLAQDMKNEVLARVVDTNLDFIKPRMIREVSDGISLDISYLGVKDISPLEGIPFVSLNLKGNPIKDISALRGMPLESLNISNTKVKSLKDLADAPLEHLEINSTEIEKFEGLEKAPLVNLMMRDSKITSFAGIKSPYLKNIQASNSKLTSLKFINFRSVNNLNINHTQVSDLSPLKNMPITNLSMRNTKVTDLSPLAKGFITHLDVSESPIEDFSALRSLPLEHFTASKTKIKNLKDLKGKRLTKLVIDRTEVTNIQELKNMPIDSLNLSHTKITNFGVLATLPLNSLNLENTKVKSLPKLNKLTENANLYLSNTELENFSTLSKVTINHLNVARTNLKSLEAFRDASIKDLNFSDTKVSDLSPIRGKSFNYLHMSDCPIEDLSPLSESLIDGINVSRIPATDFSPLAKANLTEVVAQATKITKPDFINKETIITADFSSSTIIDLSPFADSNVEYLNLAYTKVKDLTPLKTCTSLKTLDLHETSITNLRDISNLKLTELRVGMCRDLKSIKPLIRMRTLIKITIPKNVDFRFLRKFTRLRCIGFFPNENNQSAEKFWQKYDQEKAGEQ